MATGVLERVTTALACAALDPGLRGILLFDLRPELAPMLGRRLAESLAGDGGTVRTVHLGSGATEDALWTRVAPRAGSGITVSPGPLVDPPELAPGVVIVGDLSRLGLAERRAAIMLLSGDIAHIERNDRSIVWRPVSRWLAGCARTEIGGVSAHLLDRFPIRIDAAGLTAELIEELPAPEPITVPEKPVMVRAALIDYAAKFTNREAPGHRRELALARLARAVATLDGRALTTPADVDSAASLIGLSASTTARFGPGEMPAGGGPASTEPREPSEADPLMVTAQAFAASEPEPLPVAAGDLGIEATPYPEDDVEINQSPGSLRPVPARRALSALEGGWPIGSCAAERVDDIAIVATFLEAARYQVKRCPGHYRARHAMHMRPTDLRTYRRSVNPQKLLVLVLDHTCRGDWEWDRPLAPYLQWAYTGRATVCVVEVGSRDAVSEPRAQRFVASSLLDPRVLGALERPAGRCTPLAHGLELAARFLRDRVHRGRLSTEDALLVVVTDGRGNIPLGASRRGVLPDRAADEGFQDSLKVGRTIRSLGHVGTVVVDATPRHIAHLTVSLAEALGARLHSDVAGRATWAD